MVTADPPAGRKRNLQDFGLLASVSGALGVSLGDYHVNERTWTVFNQLVDRKKDFAWISKATGISELPAIHYLASARQCILKWGNDSKKVRDCLAGKIDP